jgi:hypothetical protein
MGYGVSSRATQDMSATTADDDRGRHLVCPVLHACIF